MLHVFFVVRHGNREILHAEVTRHLALQLDEAI
jgi:hypothetical protein